MVTKEDFLQWKDNYITRAFMSACRERIEDLKDLLSVEAGINSDNDNFYRGMIRAYKEVEEFRPEEDE